MQCGMGRGNHRRNARRTRGLSMEITWRIINLEWINQLGENTKVVKNIHYWVDAVDGDSMGYTWGNVQLNTDNISTFVDFDTLAESTCIQWVKDELNRLHPNGVEITEQSALIMLEENDPERVRGFGVPWQ